MKRLSLLAVLALMAAACTPSNVKLAVKVTNTSELNRCNETVELNLNSLSMADESLTRDKILVLDSKYKEVPSQVYTDRYGNSSLIFKTDVKAGETVKYYLAEGERAAYETKCHSRYVPERLDDYAFENDLIAGRIYGPALEDPKTVGQDIWVKNTSRLVIDDWFALNDYHTNHGEGMDCYKVGNTLGGGALAPILIGQDGQHIITVGNYSTWEHLTDGPVRTAAMFKYGPFEIDGTDFILERELILDASSHFVKNRCRFVQQDGELKITELPVVLGAIRHEVLSTSSGDNFIAFTEKTSDTKTPEKDGDINIGLVLNPAIKGAVVAELEGHSVLKCFVPVGKSIEFWTGNAWSQGLKSTVREGLVEGSFDAGSWAANVADFAQATNYPLRVLVEAK